MANIVSSIYEAFVQKDGSKTVHETHTDIVGRLRDLIWTALASDDLTASLAAHASDLGQSLSDAEVQANVGAVIAVGSLAVPTFVYSSTSDNLAALRAAYRDSTDRQAIMIGDYLQTLTDTQLRSIFNITLLQVTTLRTNKLAPAASLATSIRTATGQ